MHRDRHAFTLVELLVVVAIIAVLLAILLPALNQSRFEALKAQCGANMHQLITTIAHFPHSEQAGAAAKPILREYR